MTEALIYLFVHVFHVFGQSRLRGQTVNEIKNVFESFFSRTAIRDHYRITFYYKLYSENLKESRRNCLCAN